MTKIPSVEAFWKMLEATQFVKTTNSITDKVEEHPPAIQDMEAIIAIHGEFDKHAIDDWLTQSLQAQRDATLQEVLSMKRVAHQEKEVMYAQVSVVLGEVVPAQPVDNVRPLEYVKVFDIEKLTNINPTH